MKGKSKGYDIAQKIGKSVLVLAVALFVVSCASNPFKKLDDVSRPGNYDAAITEIETNRTKMYPKNSQIVYQLDAGMLQRYAGNFDKSIELLQTAEQGIEEAATKSVTQNIGAAIANDNALDYAGEDFEDIYINAFNALNYYHKGELESSVVEIRKMSEKLQYLTTKHAETDKAIMEQAEKDGVDPATVISKFANSALARYLGVLFYRASGDLNSMEVEGRLLTAAFQNAPEIYSFPIPATVAEELSVPSGTARLNVIGFSGLTPIKAEDVTRLRIAGENIKISLPTLLMRASQVTRVEVAINDGPTLNLEPIEDLSAIYVETFKRTYNAVRTRTIVRATVKAATSAATGAAANRVGGTAGAVLAVVSLGAKIAGEAEKADIRTSRFFPGKAWVTGVNLDPAAYTGTVKFYSGGTVIYQKDFEIEAKAGGLNLVEAFSLL